MFQINNCNVVIFGDVHWSKTKACRDCKASNNCINIVQLMDTLDKPVDVFLEAWYLQDEDKEKDKKYVNRLGNDWLGDVIKYNKDRLYNKHHENQLFRVHYGDFRTHSSLDFLQFVSQTLSKRRADVTHNELLVSLGILHDFKNKQFFKKFADACIKHNDFDEQMKSLFGDHASLYSDSSSLTTFIGIPTKIHRIRKQILKLSPHFQRAIIRYHNDMSKDLLVDNYTYDFSKRRREFIKDQNLEGEASFVISTAIKKWLAHFMDIYILSRMLYSIEQKNAKNVISYTGTFHAYSYNLFFAKYIKKTSHTWLYDSGDNNAKYLRCVMIPKEYVDILQNR